MPDQTLSCVDCKDEFLFSEGEQDFYASKDLTPPKRCKNCRVLKRAKMNSGGRPPRENRPMADSFGDMA